MCVKENVGMLEVEEQGGVVGIEVLWIMNEECIWCVMTAVAVEGWCGSYMVRH